MNDRIGAQIDGKYRLESVLARGGMGVLYRALDESSESGERVAIKLMRPERERADDSRSRFSLEGRTTRALCHPHIVRVLSAGEDSRGTPYLAMELLEGLSLQEALAVRGRLPVSEALALILPILGALAWAHDLGVLHRDLKPSNIFLSSQQGRTVPKLIDFGVAKVSGHEKVTRTGQVIGTIGYMAPEQASGTEPGPETDVWAIGAVLFRCLSGVEAFEGATEAKVLMQVVLGRARRLRTLEPGVPKMLASVVERALENDPARRYRDVRSLVRALVSACAADGTELPREVDPIGLPDYSRWLEHARRVDATSLELPTVDAMVSDLIRDPADDFVGRRVLLDRLSERAERAARGQGGVLLVSGEAGLGKTRLLGQFAARSTEAGARVHIAFCSEGDAAPPYWPWVQLLRMLGDTRSGDPHRLGRSGAREPASGSDGPAQRNAQVDRFRFFEEVCGALEESARAQPLVLLIDDFHWADAGSQALLAHAARRLARTPILLVAAYRAEDTSASEGLAALRTLSECDHHELDGLSPHEVRELCIHTAGSLPSETTLERLVSRSEGNPLFVKELARASSDGSELPRALPAAIRDAITRRLGKSTASCLTVLEAASVLGSTFELATLVFLCEQPAAAVLDLLSEAESARLVVRVSGSAVRFRFAHALIQEVLYAGLGAARRARLHEAAVSCLLKRRAGEPDSLPLLAHHAVRAALLGNVERAVELSLRAGRYARSRFAYEQALAHFREALEVVDLDPGEALAAERARLLVHIGDAEQRCGMREAARASYERAADVAESFGEHELLAQAALGFAGEGTLHPTVDEPGVALLERALARLPRADTPLRARLLARLAVLLYGGPDSDRIEEASREAERIAMASEDAGAIISALFARTLVLSESPHVEERLSRSSRMLEAAMHQRDGELEVFARRYRVCDLLRLGEIAACEDEICLTAEAGERFKNPFFTWSAMQASVSVLMLRGQFAEAERVAREAREIGRPFMPEIAVSTCAAQMYPVYRLEGRHAELELLVSEQLAVLPEVARRAYRGVLALDQGFTGEAREQLRWLIDQDFRRIPRDWFRMLALARLAELCTGLGDLACARWVYERLAPFAGQLFTIGSTVCEGSIDRYLGMLAATLGEHAQAEQHFSAALAINERLSAVPWLMRTRECFARALRATGESERARQLESQASEVRAARGYLQRASAGA